MESGVWAQNTQQQTLKQRDSAGKKKKSPSEQKWSVVNKHTSLQKQTDTEDTLKEQFTQKKKMKLEPIISSTAGWCEVRWSFVIYKNISGASQERKSVKAFS